LHFSLMQMLSQQQFQLSATPFDIPLTPTSQQIGF